MAFFLGIDGGGTRTVAWLGNGEGKLLASAESGPSNPLKVGVGAGRREMLKAYRAALRAAGVPPATTALQAVCAGIAGVDRESVHGPLITWMRRHIPARHCLLTSDAAIALAAAVRDGPGIVVIAGTGSIAFARDDHGELLRAGGWGIPFDDRGSGYELGRRAVTAALEAFDGRGPQTLLAEKICHHLGIRDITEIISKSLAQQQVAAIFPLVQEAVREGDLVASHLCEEAGRDLANLAVALLKRAGWTDRSMPVVRSGGVFSSSDLIRRTFVRQLLRFAPLARIEMLERPPVEGALWLARALQREKPRRTTKGRR